MKPAPPGQEHFLRYALRFGLRRAQEAVLVLASVPKAAILERFSDSIKKDAYWRARRVVAKALDRGGPSACAAIRAAQSGDAHHLGLNPESAGCDGASEALMIYLLLKGPKGQEQFRAALDSAQSSVELAVMGMALGRAWTLTAALREGPWPTRFLDWDHNHRVNDLPSNERRSVLLSSIAIFPQWAQAVERTAARGGCDPVAALGRVLVHADHCHENPLFNALSDAFSHAPAAVASALGRYPLKGLNAPTLSVTSSLSARCFQRAREIGDSNAERLEMARAMTPSANDRSSIRSSRPSL